MDDEPTGPPDDDEPSTPSVSFPVVVVPLALALPPGVVLPSVVPDAEEESVPPDSVPLAPADPPSAGESSQPVRGSESSETAANKLRL